MSAATATAARRSVADIAGAYLQLAKPRIILLLLVTTVPAMVLADGGLPSPWLVLATLVGGTMAAAGANTLNQYLERDIDRVMSRTRRRPLPSARIEPGHALAFGLVLAAAAFAWLWGYVNLLAAALALSGLAFYVLVYTLVLKRTTPANIVIGGAAGCAPVLVGWAAVTGRVGLPAVVMFAIVFVWTPPHFWALSLRYRQDYATAGVPMLPVVVGPAETTRRIVRYSFGLVVVSLALYPVGRMGPLYLVAALVLGGWFLREALALRREPGTPRAMRLFRYSISYLSLLFLAVATDTLVRFGP